MLPNSTDFDVYLTRWGLVPDGDPIFTRAARLLPVRRGGEAAMLRITVLEEAKGGEVLLNWWEGRGAARVLAVDGDALLLERAEGSRSLSAYARNGRDDEATEIICDVISELHVPRDKALPDLIPLDRWFAELWPVAATQGGIFARSAEAARALLSSEREIGALHGDIHHDNILDFGERGWLAIDPNRLCGERGYDYANLFCNPDIEDPARPVAVLPERFLRRLEIVVERSGLERKRLLQWVLAYTGLSAAWLLNDGEGADIDLAVAKLALAEIDR
ncbi:aminoglycoside phosphotransferase family protein [Hyphomicrobium sp.]|uniref:aminoglycoside phosphotransferase family protein n=1 Tax=Hyphomicrobium sp. TaxID=82 RepID=UPI002E2EC759|nr:aminoglycoside phosphotransferase family protein [Hyphomicrobium sp.]HEX2842380.1 aminoglycoside phosphotransferase family protein [Hyphomicrobium sp.]